MNYDTIREPDHKLYIGAERSAELETLSSIQHRLTLYFNDGRIYTQRIWTHDRVDGMMIGWVEKGDCELVALRFPFVEVSQMDTMFGGIPNMREVIAAVPAEFNRYNNPWCEAASSLFFHGGEVKVTKAANPEQAAAMLRYLKTWMGSFEPRHEEKEAVCGWLLSLMMDKPPKRK